MRIAIAALGSRGDTQPCVALARGLAARGHTVKVLASPSYQHVIEAAPGVTYSPISFDPKEMIESEAGQAMLNGGPLGFVKGIHTVIEPPAERVLTEAHQACLDVDLILAPAMAGVGRHIADKLGIHYGVLHFQPSEPTGEFPNPVVSRRSLGRLGNRLSYVALEWVTWLVLHRMLNRLRRSVLQIGPLRRSTFHVDRKAGVPVLCGFSSALVQRPFNWPDNVHVTGFWLNPPSRTPLPTDLVEFLAAGPAPVFIGFGSMAPSDPAAVSASIEQALKATGLRAVVQGLPQWDAAPTDVYFAEELDHAQLFPSCAAVVHHGGAGTTATGLQAGVPNLLCPFFGDQPFWASRVAAIGAGPAPLPIKELDAESLADRLRIAVSDQTLRLAARRIGAGLSIEDGVARACEAIETSFVPQEKARLRAVRQVS